MKKIITIVLALCICISVAACGRKGPSTFEKLCGTWKADREKSFSDMEEDAELIGAFEDEELEYAPPFYFDAVYCITFNEDNTYTMGIDKEVTKAYYLNWIDAMFVNLFDHKDDVRFKEDDGDYGYNNALLASESVEEFRDAYAVALEYADYAAFADDMFEKTWEIYEFDDLDEKGTFQVTEKISFTVEGETESEYVTYEFDESGNLTLGYADDKTETYSKVTEEIAAETQDVAETTEAA